LYKDFHHGVPYEEVMKRSGASDITDLLCYKGGYIFNNNEKKRTNINVLTPFNMLVEGYGKVQSTSQPWAKFELYPHDPGSCIVTSNIGYDIKVFIDTLQHNIGKNVYARADKLLDIGYGDRIISPDEVDAVRKKIVEKSYNGKYPLKVDLTEEDFNFD
jgi:hypothetical protein